MPAGIVLSTANCMVANLQVVKQRVYERADLFME